MKQELIMSGLLFLGNQMMANAQQTKTTTIERYLQVDMMRQQEPRQKMIFARS